MHTSPAMGQEQYSSKSSSEQTDRSDSEQTDHVMVSRGRFYECVFCKRGFTTAQALGGHMNIHRKERDKTKRSSVVPSSSSKSDEDCVKFRSYPSIPTNLQPQDYVTAPDQVHTHYQDFFAPSRVFGFKRSSHPQYSHGLFVQNQRVFNLFDEDWRRNFDCIEDDKGKMKAGSDDNDLIDLELRLGHYP